MSNLPLGYRALWCESRGIEVGFPLSSSIESGRFYSQWYTEVFIFWTVELVGTRQGEIDSMAIVPE